jgi:hypothetical protein
MMRSCRRRSAQTDVLFFGDPQHLFWSVQSIVVSASKRGEAHREEGYVFVDAGWGFVLWLMVEVIWGFGGF